MKVMNNVLVGPSPVGAAKSIARFIQSKEIPEGVWKPKKVALI